MSFALLIMVMAVFGLVTGASLIGFMLGRRQLPPAAALGHDRRLAEQVELLEEELRRVKDQADFTERLITERGSAEPEDARPFDEPD
jgi:hypothetical protein